jgi:hypothetical protein
MPDPIKPIPTREEFEKTLEEIHGQKESGEKLLEALERFHDELQPEYFNASTLRQAIDQYKESGARIAGKNREKFTSLESSVGEYETIQRTFLLPAHMAAIEHHTKRRRVAIGIRETGEATLGKLSESCLPKPHSIEEKSIKESSLNEKYGPVEGPQVLNRIRGAHADDNCKINIEGLVGHWDEHNVLKGFRVDKQDAVKSDEGVSLCEPVAPKGFYFPVNVSSQDALVTSLAPLKQEINRENWKQHAYTGDYDLHHILVKTGAGGPHPTASDDYEEKRNIKELNSAMPGERKGTDDVLKSGITPHTLFQHGPQASYYAHALYQEVRRERQQQQRPESVNERNARPSYPLVNCDGGQWRHILNEKELRAAYEAAGVKLKGPWKNEESYLARRESRKASATGPTASSISRKESISSLRRRESNDSLGRRESSGSIGLKESIDLDPSGRRGSGSSLGPHRRQSGPAVDPLAETSRRPSLQNRKLSSESGLSVPVGSGSTTQPQRRGSDSSVGSSSRHQSLADDSSPSTVSAKRSTGSLPVIRTGDPFSSRSGSLPFSPISENTGPSDAQSSLAGGANSSMGNSSSAGFSGEPPGPLPRDKPLEKVVWSAGFTLGNQSGPSGAQRRSDSPPRVTDETGSEHSQAPPRSPSRGRSRSPSRGGGNGN